MDWAMQLEVGLKKPEPAFLADSRQARTLADEGHYGSALEILWNQLLPARREDDAEKQAFIYVHMAKVYRNWMWNLAHKYYRHGREAAQRAGYLLAELVACCGMGEIHRDWNEPQKAFTLYEHALELAENLHDVPLQRAMLLELAECCRIRGEVARERALRAEAERLADEPSPREGEERQRDADTALRGDMTAGAPPVEH